MKNSAHPFRIGAVQTDPIFGDKQTNREEIEELIQHHEANLWVMPELALTGYEFKGRGEAMDLGEEIPDGESTKWLHQLCRDRNFHAVMGIAERHKDKIYNSCIMVGPHGLIGRYRKLHLFEREHLRFDAGDLPLSIYDIGPARVGMMICFDWIYPETARTLALRGAQIIAHPANLVMPYCQQSMRTRALENRVFAITSNRVGNEERDGRKIGFTGKSQILSVLGDSLACADDIKASCIVAEINPQDADDKQMNSYNNLLTGRRKEFYAVDIEHMN